MFSDENFRLDHDGAGVLSMANSGPNTNCVDDLQGLPAGLQNLQNTCYINTAEREKGKSNKDEPVDIWWDLENGPVPHGFPAKEVFPSFLKKLKEEGFTGRVKVTAVVGYLNHPVPAGLGPKIRVKFAKKINRPPLSQNDQVADKAIKRRIQKWLLRKKKPRNIMLITGDVGFRNIMESLKAAGHQILLALIQGKEEHCSADIMELKDHFWEWRDFLSHVPDGFNSVQRKRNRFVELQAKKKHERKMRKEKEKKKKKEKEKKKKKKAMEDKKN